MGSPLFRNGLSHQEPEVGIEEQIEWPVVDDDKTREGSPADHGTLASLFRFSVLAAILLIDLKSGL